MEEVGSLYRSVYVAREIAVHLPAYFGTIDELFKSSDLYLIQS